MTTRRVTATMAVLALALAACGGSGTHQTAPPTSSQSTTPATDPNTVSPTSTPPSNAGTTTTVLGPSGSTANYPAAQPTPPSLTGAYPVGNTVNLVTVLKTLSTYRDWVWSHPNPALVANYELRTGDSYTGEVKNLTLFQQKRLHADPIPTVIDFVRVTLQPKAYPPLANGQPALINGHQSMEGGSVTAVYTIRPVLMLDANGQPSGQQFTPTSVGQLAYVVTLAQGPDGQFRFQDSDLLNPPGGISAVEHQS